MTALPRILVCAVYFGPLPECFPLWLLSCGFNPQVNWLVVTDADTSRYAPPPNVRFRAMSMAGFAELVGAAVGSPVALTHAYKVADLKPFYWTLLDPAEHWAFWGHCDLDMIFGDLGRFLPPALFERHDKIFSVGHFTLYRNTPAVNGFYRRPCPGLDWRAVLADPVHHGFDEHIGINRIWKHHGGRVHHDETVMADIDPTFARVERTAPHRNHSLQVFGFDRGQVKRYAWRGGRIVEDAFMYIHLQKRRLPTADLPPEADRFYITPRGFVPMGPATPTRAEIAALNPKSPVPPVRELDYRLRRRLRLWRGRLLGRNSLHEG